MTAFIKGMWTICRKDMALEFKTKEIMSSMLMFAVLVVVVFSFIFEPGFAAQTRVVGGIYWMAVIFAGLLGLGRSMQSEINGGNLEAILLTPVGRNAFFFGKVSSILLLILFVQLVMIPLFVVFYSVNFIRHINIIWTIIGTSYAFALLGTLFSMISSRSSTREILLPLLLLPMLIPVIIAAIQCTNGVLHYEPSELYMKWLQLIFVFDVIFTALISVLFEPVVED